MCATITDWETKMPATPESFVQNVKLAFRHFKEVGATNLRVVKISDSRARTMNLWPDEETAVMAIEAITEVGSSLEGVRIVGSEKAAMLAELG